MPENLQSKAIVYQEMMVFIKEHKKEFLRGAVRNWGNRTICTQAATTGWQMYVKGVYMKQQARKGDDLIALGRAIQGWFQMEKLRDNNFEIFMKVIIRLHVKYAEKIENRWLKTKERPPNIRNTEILMELFQRGFVFATDLPLPVQKIETPFLLIAQDQLTIWPHIFDSKETAEKVNERIGMPGITRVISDAESIDTGSIIDDLPF